MTVIASSPASTQTRLERWQAFLAPGAAPGYLFHVPVHDGWGEANPAPHPWPSEADARVEYAWRCYERMGEHRRLIDDDQVPYLRLATGTEIFAEAFGCSVHRPGDGMPFALPFVRTPAEAEKVRTPDLSHSTLAYLFEMMDVLYERAGPGAITQLVDIQSPLDIVALIWDKAELFVAMIEAPAAVRELAAKVRVLLIAFLDEWFRRYGTTYVAHFPDYVMHGGLTLSEDEIGAVSPDCFEAFFKPELVALSDHFGGIGMHCCAQADHQWDGLSSLPGLRVLNLCVPPTETDPDGWTKRAHAHFAGVCAQMHFPHGLHGDPATWPAQMPADCRMIIKAPTPDVDEARRFAEVLAAQRDAGAS